MIKKCEYCKNEFEIKNCHYNQRFCCKSCATRYRHNDDIGVFSRNDVADSVKKYIIGLILTDGCLRKNGKSITICISLKDRYMIEMIHDIACPSKKIYKDGNNWQVVWKNRFDSDYLESISITCRKTLTVKLPSLDNMWSLVRGIFDGDGCVFISKTRDSYTGKIYSYVYISITSGSIHLIEELSEFLSNNNICNTINKDSRKGNVYYLKIRKRESVKRMRDLMYAQAGNWKLERKYKIFIDNII